MKKTDNLIAYSAIICSMIVLGSCTKICDEGYENKHCTTEIREKFLHSYYSIALTTTRDSCLVSVPVADFNDTSSIIAGTNVNEIKFTNIKLKTNSITLMGKVDADNKITIPQQIVSSHTFRGDGTYNAGNISLTYTAIKGCDTMNCAANLTR